MKIYVLTNGFVLKGVEKDGLLYNAGYIREWGTDEGIGQLSSGALKNTKIDSLPDGVSFNKDALLFEFDAPGFK